MKTTGSKTVFRLTKDKIVTSCCVIAVMVLCCVSAVAVNTLLNYSDVQALRVDPGSVIDYNDVIPEEYAPDRDHNGIKNPIVTSDTKAGQKMATGDNGQDEPEETEETSESANTFFETSSKPTESITETEEPEETEPEETESEETEPSSTTKAKQTAKKPTESPFKKTVYTRAVVNLRTGPGTSYKVVKKVNSWQPVKVIAKTSNGWYKTSDGCYVKQSLTTLAAPKPTATKKPTKAPTKKPTKPTAKATTTTKKTTVKKVNGVKCKITFYGPVLYKRKDGSTFYSTTTATGTKCKQGRTCAADWSVFPKNSWVYIENDPLGGDGLYKVEDRGNFKGNWIDIYVDSAKGHSTCYRKVYQQ